VALIQKTMYSIHDSICKQQLTHKKNPQFAKLHTDIMLFTGN